MNLQEYAGHEALGLAQLVERREVSLRDRKPPIHIGRGRTAAADPTHQKGQEERSIDGVGRKNLIRGTSP